MGGSRIIQLSTNPTGFIWIQAGQSKTSSLAFCNLNECVCSFHSSNIQVLWSSDFLGEQSETG